MVSFSFGISLLNEKENRELIERVKSLEKDLKDVLQDFIKTVGEKDILKEMINSLEKIILNKNSQVDKLSLELEEARGNRNEVVGLYSQEQQKVIDLKARVIDLESLIKELQDDKR